MRRLQSWTVVLLVLGLMALTPVVGASPPEYEMIELDSIGPGPYHMSVATGINNQGLIVGQSAENVASLVHLVVWDDGELQDLGTHPSEPDWNVEAHAVNDRGQIVGLVYEVCPSPEPGVPSVQGFNCPNTAGFVYEDGEWTLIKADGAVAAKAVDINARGQVLGSEYHPDHGLRTFIWRNGTFAYLDGLALDQPTAINDRGQVAGWYLDAASVARGVVWTDGVVVEIGDPTVSTYVWDVNNHGQVAGHQGSEAFVWHNEQATGLPRLGEGFSGAYSINDRGQIAGVSEGTHAVIWSGGTVIDLGTAGGGCTAQSVNASAHVAGACFLPTGPMAFLWEK